VIRGKYGIFWSGSFSPSGNHCAVKYMTGTQALTGEILKILNLSHETISVYLVD